MRHLLRPVRPHSPRRIPPPWHVSYWTGLLHMIVVLYNLVLSASVGRGHLLEARLGTLEHSFLQLNWSNCGARRLDKGINIPGIV